MCCVSAATSPQAWHGGGKMHFYETLEVPGAPRAFQNRVTVRSTLPCRACSERREACCDPVLQLQEETVRWGRTGAARPRGQGCGVLHWKTSSLESAGRVWATVHAKKRYLRRARRALVCACLHVAVNMRNAHAYLATPNYIQYACVGSHQSEVSFRRGGT